MAFDQMGRWLATAVSLGGRFICHDRVFVVFVVYTIIIYGTYIDYRIVSIAYNIRWRLRALPWNVIYYIVIVNRKRRDLNLSPGLATGTLVGRERARAISSHTEFRCCIII